MNETLASTSRLPSDLRVVVNSLYADHPSGPSVMFDRMSDTPDPWLRDHGVYSQPDAEPVVVMLDVSSSRFTHNEYGDTVALHSDNDHPLLTIERAIAALELAHAALVAAGTADFVPSELADKGDVHDPRD
ncbi:hypothetical protein PWY87_34135 [Kribbella solani]|uniref:hypothetical protein n=1 Tax=Kribbella solani TaxID=236067 RepID=UPI0029A1E866|nr:hypothetical protein [Kribbella solani]MDX3006757.1 hypothetical protein [Kribbella solani]